MLLKNHLRIRPRLPASLFWGPPSARRRHGNALSLQIITSNNKGARLSYFVLVISVAKDSAWKLNAPPEAGKDPRVAREGADGRVFWGGLPWGFTCVRCWKAAVSYATPSSAGAHTPLLLNVCGFVFNALRLLRNSDLNTDFTATSTENPHFFHLLFSEKAPHPLNINYTLTW